MQSVLLTPQQTDQRYILSWSCYCEGMRLPLRGGELERKLVLRLIQSHLYLSLECCLGDFLHLLKIKTNLRGVGSLDSISSGCGNSVGIWLLATSCFPKLSQQVFTLFPARLHESFLSPCPPIFNSFSFCLGWEGKRLDCCVQGCFCLCSMWNWMMEVEELAWCEFRKWWLGQATTKVWVLGRREISFSFASC